MHVGVHVGCTAVTVRASICQALHGARCLTDEPGLYNGSPASTRPATLTSTRPATAPPQDLEAGKLPVWAATPAPPLAVAYWKLPAGATMRHLLLAVRADEACHSHVNHTFAGMKADETNPFAVGSHIVP
jgi:hypothetical protein